MVPSVVAMHHVGNVDHAHNRGRDKSSPYDLCFPYVAYRNLPIAPWKSPPALWYTRIIPNTRR